jgi:hypothetical protein
MAPSSLRPRQHGYIRRMIAPADLGPIYTPGNSFRARAEQRQREVRARAGIGHGDWGHWLGSDAAANGANFATQAGHRAASSRALAGKGVGDRTFENMLSSQAMCFNLFAPLALDLALATDVLGRVIDGLSSVRAFAFEYTPLPDIFGDQSARGGVDCDLRIDGTWTDGQPALVTIETKFVEPEFSACAFRDPKRLKAKNPNSPPPYCADTVGDAASSCLYSVRKGYRYWKQTRRYGTLISFPVEGCPFGGGEWQLWVNHVLAYALADEVSARPLFVVCAPEANKRLDAKNVVGRFKARLSHPESCQFLALDFFLEAVRAAVVDRPPELRAWSAALDARYGGFRRDE